MKCHKEVHWYVQISIPLSVTMQTLQTQIQLHCYGRHEQYTSTDASFRKWKTVKIMALISVKEYSTENVLYLNVHQTSDGKVEGDLSNINSYTYVDLMVKENHFKKENRKKFTVVCINRMQIIAVTFLV